MSASALAARSKRFARALLLPALLALGWQLLSRDAARSSLFVPLQTVAHSAVALVLGGDLLFSVLGSLRKALAALLLGGSAGLAVGSLLAASKRADRAFGPLLHAMRQVPALGLAPLMGLWFGTGEVAKILLIFLSVFYPVLLSTYAGVRSIDPRFFEVARVFSLDRRETFLQLMFPAMLPLLYSGLSQAVAFAWISTVGSEMLLSSGAGIGTLMQQSQAAGRVDVVIVCVLCVGALSMSFDWALNRLRRRLMRWQDTATA